MDDTPPPGPPSTQSRWPWVIGIAAAVVAVSAIAVTAGLLVGRGDDAASTTTTTTAPTTTSTDVTTTTTEAPTTTTTEPEPEFRAVLTGLPVDDPVILLRPALMVKVDNTGSSARPQAGLLEADVVFEEMIEGGDTRFAVVYHSTDAPLVGPIRSARSTDLDLVTLFDRPLFAYSGANAVFAAQVAAAPLVNVSWSRFEDLFEKRRDRRAPNDLFSSTAALYTADPPGEFHPPRELFWFRPDGEALVAAGAEPVIHVRVVFSGGDSRARDWIWDPAGEKWLRIQEGTPHVDTDGRQVAAENVVVQFVPYVDTGLVDSIGTAVPEGVLVGEGEAWVLSDGQLVVGRWLRPTSADPTFLVDAAGAPIELTPGRTWVELVPSGSGRASVELAGEWDGASVPGES